MGQINQYTSKSVVFGLTFANTILAALKTVPSAALISSGKVRLSNNPSFNPVPTSTITSLAANECAYSGYTAGGIAVSLTTGLILDGVTQGATTSALFEATTATTFVPDVAYGYWIDDGTNMIMSERFANGGVGTFSAPGNFLDLIVLLPYQLLQTI